MGSFSATRWKAAVDILVLVSMLIGLIQSVINDSDEPAMRTFAVVGLAWALTTGVSYGLRLWDLERGRKLEKSSPKIEEPSFSLDADASGEEKKHGNLNHGN